ncbi:MAG TPA: hypothetical protein VLS47_07465 [Gallionella sp.]|nr:hypothetical protein [Gallionella sp.]
MPKIFINIKQSINDGSRLPQSICAPIACVPDRLRTAWVQRVVIAVALLGQVNFVTLAGITNLQECRHGERKDF